MLFDCDSVHSEMNVRNSCLLKFIYSMFLQNYHFSV